MTASPRLTEQLLASLGATAGFRDPLLGDLAEEFARRVARDGEPAARRWYRREALRAAPHLLYDGVRHLRARDVVHLVGVVFTAWVLLGVVVALVAVPLAGVVLQGTGVDLASLLAPGAGRLPWQHPLLAAVMLELATLVALAGGRIAAALYGRAPLVGAIALGMTWTTLGLVVGALGGGIPLWYRAAASVATLVGATLGGLLAVRALSARVRAAG